MTDALNTYDEEKVADALKHSWVYYLPRWLWPYAQLARWERPIGWQLLMWPCFWSTCLALLHEAFPILNAGSFNLFFVPNAQNLGFYFIYAIVIAITFLLPLTIGSFLMRGAGCTYNDLADIDIDNQVDRTQSRPLPSGRVKKDGAIIFLILQCLAGFFILLFVAGGISFTFWLGVASLITVAIYPFMKRITWWPQLFLGLAFSWGALMGWAIVFQSLSIAPILLYIGTIFWVIGYDTIYAHQDREDDAIVGVKSTARLFGEKSKFAISILYGLALVFFTASYIASIPPTSWFVLPAYLGLILGAVQMFWQISNIDIHDGDQCLRLFKSNSRFGFVLFAGLFISVGISSLSTL